MKLQSLYDVEHELIKALPKMAKASSNEDLKNAFENHLIETESHVTRLEEAFDMLDEKPKKLPGESIRGLIADGAWVIKKVSGPALDANLIAAASYVEHYEIAGYVSAIRWAEEIDSSLADTLRQTLEEEQHANDKLVSLAEEEVDKEVEV